MARYRIEGEIGERSTGKIDHMITVNSVGLAIAMAKNYPVVAGDRTNWARLTDADGRVLWEAGERS